MMEIQPSKPATNTIKLNSSVFWSVLVKLLFSSRE